MNEASQICGKCAAENPLEARRCQRCGATLRGAGTEHTIQGQTEAELEATFVPPEQREAVQSFDDEVEAELAAGYLRANGITAEVGKMIIPGLPYEIALWVRKETAAEARHLLEEAEDFSHI